MALPSVSPIRDCKRRCVCRRDKRHLLRCGNVAQGVAGRRLKAVPWRGWAMAAAGQAWRQQGWRRRAEYGEERK